MKRNQKQRFDVDPVLEKISPHIPDKEIDFLFPYRKFNIQGRSKSYKTSQLYRAHILTLIKGVTSFNKMCSELKSRRSFRDFCRFKNKNATPTNRILSEFRGRLNPSGFEQITRLITLTFLNTIKLPLIKVAVPDATDMPANCKGFAKKNAHALQTANARKGILLKKQLQAKGLRRAVRVLTLLDIRSIHYAFG